ncbi:regulator of G-protein signaling 7-like isoform X2 [Clytia hemisphaerica]|uniref:regulator of G-protein signaling 7-like isoform X2 n=2 Tax=Clytia hemisphaerica TaxID=252671 RepID=UPI0034D5CABE
MFSRRSYKKNSKMMGTEWKLDSQLRASLERIEKIVFKLQDSENGVPVTNAKALFHTIPNVCTGADIVTWLKNDLELKTRAEALNVARTIAKYGYIFVASDSKLTVKDDLTHHRFQHEFFWPTKERAISNSDYAVHLCKRLFSNKNRSNLEVYEMDQFTRLQRHLGHKWEHIWVQAEASYKVDKKKSKAEQYVIESQERAFWNLHKPPPYSDYVLAADPLKFKKNATTEAITPLSPDRAASTPSILRRHSVDSLRDDAMKLGTALQKAEAPKAVESLISYCMQYNKFDPLLRQPSTTSSNSAFYTEESNNSNDASRRGSQQVERWAISLEELLRDKEGVLVFLKHLEKEHSSENLRFWLACEEYKACPLKKVPEKAEQIYKEYLSRSAFYQVNLDSKLMVDVEEGMKNPNHFTFRAAQHEIFRLMRSDSYPRFLKSENFVMLSKEANSPSHKGQEKKGILSILTSPQHKV